MSLPAKTGLEKAVSKLTIVAAVSFHLINNLLALCVSYENRQKEFLHDKPWFLSKKALDNYKAYDYNATFTLAFIALFYMLVKQTSNQREQSRRSIIG
jgi:hypothetical protein